MRKMITALLGLAVLQAIATGSETVSIFVSGKIPCDNEVEEEWCEVAEGQNLCVESFYEDRCLKTCGICARVVKPPCEDVKRDWCQNSVEVKCYNPDHQKLCQKTCMQCRRVPEGFCGDDMYKKDCEFMKEHNYCQFPYSRDRCRKTCGVCGRKTPFPIEQEEYSKWSWAHDGTNDNGIVELLADGAVTWKGG